MDRSGFTYRRGLHSCLRAESVRNWFKLVSLLPPYDISTTTLSTPSFAYLVQGRLQPFGQGDGVAVGPEMHEEQPGLLIQHVVVGRGHLDAVGPEGLDDGSDLGGQQHEIAVDGGLLPLNLEVQGGVHAHVAWDISPHHFY